VESLSIKPCCVVCRKRERGHADVTKAERIREMGKLGWSTREIADVIGCRPEYVRVALRQRADGKRSKHDIAYAIKKYGSLQAYAAERYRAAKEKQAAYYRRRWSEDPEFRADQLARNKAWRERRKAKAAQRSRGRVSPVACE
jgi:hypothetical protein